MNTILYSFSPLQLTVSYSCHRVPSFFRFHSDNTNIVVDVYLYRYYITTICTKNYTKLFFFSFNLTYSRWTSSVPSCLWSQRIFPSLPGSRLTIFYRDASSAFLQLVNRWWNFTYPRSHAFRYERKNTIPTLVRIELTTPVLEDVQLTY